ncbi:hypothetical protein BDZ97DRAFT_1846352 [Flammula alnicola]|nr:hypothetical protein BDZ97DRAFT_1846352 [Flammula alnicola]
MLLLRCDFSLALALIWFVSWMYAVSSFVTPFIPYNTNPNTQIVPFNRRTTTKHKRACQIPTHPANRTNRPQLNSTQQDDDDADDDVLLKDREVPDQRWEIMAVLGSTIQDSLLGKVRVR